MKVVNVGATGMTIKRPVFAGACKACPWGVLALITQAAMKPIDYDVKICFVYWSEYGPREMADRLKPVFPTIPVDDQVTSYIENPPDAVPDISATSLTNLTAAWNGTGPYAKDHKTRHNYRIIAVVHQPNFMMMAATRKSGITDLAQVKDRTAPTWIAFPPRDQATQAWYEASQLDDLVFFDMPEPLRTTVVAQGSYRRADAPIALLRGVERPVPTVTRSENVIYVRADAPDRFTYAVAKALDQHQDLFRMYGDPWYYDIHSVAVSPVIPMAPGALKYYREGGYVR